MRTKIFAIGILGLSALASPASAQIIATSIPREEVAGTGKGLTAVDKRFAFHIMGSPFAKWDYGELFYVLPVIAGSVHGNPNSSFLFAGDVAFAAGRDFSIGAGGWYNKIGAHSFDFAGFAASSDIIPFGNAINGRFDTDLKAYEGHLSLFYKDVGVQGGIVRTTARLGPTATITSLDIGLGQGVQANPNPQPFAFTPPEGTTTDLDLFGVYKHAFVGGGLGSARVNLALGAGIYRKRGTVFPNPLRSDADKTVFTAFATLNVDVYKGIGIDISYWYIGKTGVTNEFSKFTTQTLPTDTQSRFTVGVGYTFSR